MLEKKSEREFWVFMLITVLTPLLCEALPDLYLSYLQAKGFDFWFFFMVMVLELKFCSIFVLKKSL